MKGTFILKAGDFTCSCIDKLDVANFLGCHHSTWDTCLYMRACMWMYKHTFAYILVYGVHVFAWMCICLMNMHSNMKTISFGVSTIDC